MEKIELALYGEDGSTQGYLRDEEVAFFIENTAKDFFAAGGHVEVWIINEDGNVVRKHDTPATSVDELKAQMEGIVVQKGVVQKGFVITETGTILVQLPDDNPTGFVLASDDQTWPGGNGVAGSWEMIPADDPRISKKDHERLDWLLK